MAPSSSSLPLSILSKTTWTPMYRSYINPGLLTSDEGFIYQDAEAQVKIVDLLREKNIRVRSRINCHLDDNTSCWFPTHRRGHIHLRHNHARVEHRAKQRLTVRICIVTELSILKRGGLCLKCPDPSNPLNIPSWTGRKFLLQPRRIPADLMSIFVLADE